jgi:DNA mismatch repair protein MutL
MPKITILTEATANKISAGEVIERPSSVVKELVENSIDAGSRKISVELQAGGKRFMRVTDDGCGMSYDDALLCLERHATSKISDASDLYNITTLGFRGEAIPSIAAVSKMEIVTRSGDDLSATCVVIEGGAIRSVGEKGAPAGTQITVRQLFYNTPARLKFMKSNATELGHATSMLQRQALAHPRISFRLVTGERETLNLPPASTVTDRFALVWGNDFADQLRRGERESERLKVTGYFGTPALTRSNRNHQFFFLNRRPITNRLLGKALGDAYHGSIMSDRFPVAFIFIEIDPQLIDVNIHPTKREVKFADPDSVFDAVREAFGAAFERAPHDHAPRAPEQLADSPPTRQPEPSERELSRTQPLFQRITMNEDDIAAAMSQLEELDRAGTGMAVPPARPTADFSAVSPDMGYVKQIFQSYLLCIEGGDLFIIDQHALHERLLYDELVMRESQSTTTTQQLLIPITFELSPDRAEVLSAHLDLFSRIGIEVQPFGPRTFAVTALAHLHSEKHILESVREGVDELYMGLKVKAPREILRRLMTISACKNSIKAGDTLTESEVEMLLEGLKNLAQPPTCLHGRPLVLRLSESQIARAFGRKG